MKPDQELQDEYVASDGNFCPYCKCEVVEATTNVIIEGGFASQTVQCTECKHDWNEYYKIAGFSDLKETIDMSIPVIIAVRGGCVASVYSSDEDIKVEILDYDNYAQETDDGELERMEKLRKDIKKMKEVF